jgi:glycosyltransferase involved in cell wall biosynthesis
MNRQPAVVMLMRQFYPLTGGYQNQALRLAQEMIERNIQVCVVSQRHSSLRPYEIYQGVPIHRVFAFRSGHLAALSYFCSTLLWMVRNQHKFEIVHANRSSSGLIAGLSSFVLGKRSLYKLTRGDEIAIKGLRSTLLGRLKVQLLKHTVDKFIAITEGIENDLKRLGIPQRKLARIPNGINPYDFAQPGEKTLVRSELGWGSDTKVITFVGRLIPEKGLDWLLRVWTDVVDHEPLARLLIVGEGAQRSALEAQAESLGIKNTVAFVGYQKQVPRFLAAADVFVLPSRLEGVSNALLEAMAQGLAVVVADDELGGNREVVDDQVNGFVVPFGDRGAFAEILRKLLENAALRNQVGQKAKLKIEERFSIRSVADEYCEIYNQLSDGSKSA